MSVARLAPGRWSQDRERGHAVGELQGLTQYRPDQFFTPMNGQRGSGRRIRLRYVGRDQNDDAERQSKSEDTPSMQRKATVQQVGVENRLPETKQQLLEESVRMLQEQVAQQKDMMRMQNEKFLEQLELQRKQFQAEPEAAICARVKCCKKRKTTWVR